MTGVALKDQRLELLVQGAHCAGCLNKIERNISALSGVTHARMNLTTGKLAVQSQRGEVSPDLVIETLSDLGYRAVPYDPVRARQTEDKEGRRLAIALGVAGFGAGNAMMFAVPVWAGLMGQEMGEGVRTAFYWLTALIAGPCALYAGMPFFESAWKALSKGKANMDVPISLGVILSLGVSVYETLLPKQHAYFEAAVTLLFLLLIGRYLDHRLRAQAKSAARDLLALQAITAQRLGPEGLTQSIALDQVQVDDRLMVVPGDRVPGAG